MPDEPNRNVEEQLKTWAQKRREEAEAPFELHPATRRMLQDEVARTFPEESDAAADVRRRAALSEPNHPPPDVRGYGGGWLKVLRPRFALIGWLCTLIVILLGLSLPTLFQAKSKAQRIIAFKHLEAIGLAARVYAGDHNGRFPSNFQQMRDELGGVSADTLAKDPETGKDFVYLGAGKVEGDRDSILAYSPIAKGRRPVLLADGYVQEMDETQFNDALRRTANGVTTVALASPQASKPALAENKPLEQEVLVQSEPKDARLKTVDQLAKDETRKSPETSRSLELSYADRAKEAAPSEGRPDSRDRGAGPVNGRNRLLMERDGLAPRRAETGAVVPADKQAAAAQPQAPPVANAQVTLEAANVGRSAGVGGGGFGAAVATNQVALNELGQQYAQVRRYRVNFNSPPMPNVLRSFQVEQAGQQIRVVDADGSVYDGAIERPENEEFAKRVAAAQTAQEDLKKKVEPEARRGESVSETAYGETAGPQNVFFHVAGTNRTLNQLVVFQGNFLANTNQTSAILQGARLATDKSALVPQQSPPLQIRSQLPNALIQGQATIGDRNRVQINASPVGP